MCRRSDCDGCAYSKLSALLHKGPRSECYTRFFVHHLPWNILKRTAKSVRKALQGAPVVSSAKRKEVRGRTQMHPVSAK